MKKVLFCFLLWMFAAHSFAQSSTGAPAQNVTKPLSLLHLDAIKNQNPERTFPVKSTNGNMVAEIGKIVLDAENRQPCFAVLHLYDNVAEHRPFTVVPWEMLTIEQPTGDIVIQTSVAQLRKAPKSATDNFPLKAEGDWGQQYYTFYNVKPKATAAGSGMLPSGTIKGSDSNLPQAPDTGRASRVFLWSAVAAAVLVFLLLVLNRRRAT